MTEIKKEQKSIQNMVIRKKENRKEFSYFGSLKRQS
jgi:hypothetical protein